MLRYHNNRLALKQTEKCPKIATGPFKKLFDFPLTKETVPAINPFSTHAYCSAFIWAYAFLPRTALFSDLWQSRYRERIGIFDCSPRSGQTPAEKGSSNAFLNQEKVRTPEKLRKYQGVDTPCRGVYDDEYHLPD